MDNKDTLDLILDFFKCYLWVIILMIPGINILFMRMVKSNALLEDIFKDEEVDLTEDEIIANMEAYSEAYNQL